MDKKVLNSMFENLLHIGNKTNYWSPKMKDYIYGSVNGVHVINLIKTEKKLAEVKATLKELAIEGKKILFVATKLQARDAFTDLAKETGHFYVSEKWVPGLLTNFKTIKRRISTYLKLIRDSETGALDMLTKKEKAAKLLELEKLDRAFRGLKEMKKVPEIVFAVDGIYEKQAIKEANTLNLRVFSIFNTNGDDTIVENLIPSNTNSVKSLEFLAASLKEALAGIKVVRKTSNVKRITDRKPVIKKMETEKKAPVKEELTEKKVVKKEELKKTLVKKIIIKKEVTKTKVLKKEPTKTEKK